MVENRERRKDIKLVSLILITNEVKTEVAKSSLVLRLDEQHSALLKLKSLVYYHE